LLSYFYGRNSPRDNPEQYLSCIKNLVQYYDEHFRGKVPLIVNTHGWIRGPGYSMLLDILGKVRPTDIIQIYKQLDPKSRQPLWYPLNNEDIEALGLTVKSTEGLSPHDIANTDHEVCFIHSVPSVSVTISSPCIDTTPDDDRALRILSYFKASSGSTGMTYTVPWHKLGIKFLGHNVPPSQALWALNGSIVGLAICTALSLKTNEEYPTFLAPSQLNDPIESVGLGIIKSIDPCQHKITIVTPIPFQLLSNVNVIIKGTIELPSMLLLLMESGTNTPYIASDSVATKNIGGSTKKRRMFVKRQHKPIT